MADLLYFVTQNNAGLPQNATAGALYMTNTVCLFSARVQSDLLNAEGDINSTKTILVQNIPSSLDEDMIEAFFESTKKGGGGPVNKLELNMQKHWAVVEFSNPKGK